MSANNEAAARQPATSPLLSAVRSALAAVGLSADGVREDDEDRVWIDESLYIDHDPEAYYVMRDTAVPGFGYSDQVSDNFLRVRGDESRDVGAMRQAASALVREWVREQLDAWGRDDGGGE